MQKLRTMIATLRNALGVTTTSKEHTFLTESQVIWWKSCDTLPIKTFYEILKTENLSLLGNASQESLEQAWIDILDEYWQLVDAAKYRSNIRKSRSLLKLQNKYIGLNAALVLYDLGNTKGIEIIKYFGIKTAQEAKQRVLVLKTQLAIDAAKREKNSAKSTDYNVWKDLTRIEQVLGRSIDIEKTTVAHWIELNKIAKEISNGRNKKK